MGARAVFCNRFDETLATSGPGAVFLPDPEGLFRLDESWTRDAWERCLDAGTPEWRYVLLRDRATGYVQLALATSTGLLAAHPRSDVRSYPTLDAARAARDAFGAPPITREPW
jgi:hypothetical protein